MKSYIALYDLLCVNHASQGLSFNTDFLEANVINITILLFGLVYVLKQFLGAL